LDEPKGSFFPIPIRHEDFFFEESDAMNGLSKRRVSAFKSDSSNLKECTGKDVNDWNHRALFPPSLPSSDNLSDNEIINHMFPTDITL